MHLAWSCFLFRFFSVCKQLYRFWYYCQAVCRFSTTLSELQVLSFFLFFQCIYRVYREFRIPASVLQRKCEIVRGVLFSRNILGGSSRARAPGRYALCCVCDKKKVCSRSNSFFQFFIFWSRPCGIENFSRRPQRPPDVIQCVSVIQSGFSTSTAQWTTHQSAMASLSFIR